MLPSISFLLAATALAIVPGPGIAYVVARTVAGGRAEGIASSVGTAGGGMVHVVLSALGLSLLIAESSVLYSAIKYLGAAYLLYLGLKILLARPKATDVPHLARAGAKKAFRDGIVVEALNVKTAMFFIAFIPQFVDPAHHVVQQFALLGFISVALNTAADIIYVFIAARLRSGIRARPQLLRRVRQVSGTIMCSLGAALLLTRRPV